MLVLTFFACFGKQVSIQLQSPVKEWQSPIHLQLTEVEQVEEESPAEEPPETKWEAMSNLTNPALAKSNCRQKIVNAIMLSSEDCKEVDQNTTLCLSSVNPRIKYGMLNGKVVCKRY